ncbi:30S ribosomal protein S7 [Candidatus Microgenomates bacterium]|nr:30S ribosomal protein S7 [Candidatus Microgenomates bacterium]
MPRNKRTKKRILSLDSIYNSRLVARFINRVMKQGKKSVAQKHVYGAFDLIRENIKEEPLEVFRGAVENVKPNMEVRPRRVGGASYQVPMPVRGDRKESLAVRWLVLAARGRSNKEYHTYKEKLAAELIDAYKNTGGAVKKKEEINRMAEANRAFAHFRW